MTSEFHMIYVTADDSDFTVDFQNMANMLKYDPGISKVNLYVIINQIHDAFRNQKLLENYIRQLFSKSEKLRLKAIKFGVNVGRDFGGVNIGLDHMIQDGMEDQDFIMIRNRSAYGPFLNNWYSNYAHLFTNHNVGLVGNTINLRGHKQISNENYTHVQTYLYLSKGKILREMKGSFPGSDAKTRLEVIREGEFGLSRKIMRMGYDITCLNWPDRFFNATSQIDEDLPLKDLKRQVTHLPFIHRKGMKQYMPFYKRLLWKIRFFIFRIKSS